MLGLWSSRLDSLAFYDPPKSDGKPTLDAGVTSRKNRGVGAPKMSRRSSGVLLHPTSLPGPHGSGDLGATARRFVDFLADAGQTWWQMLPVGPPGYGNSPYSALSAFAGSTLLVSLDMLAQEGLLDARVLGGDAHLPHDRVDYSKTARFRHGHLRAAFDSFVRKGGETERAYLAFVGTNASWLDEFSLYAALKAAHGETHWTAWEQGVKKRDPVRLAQARRDLAREIGLVKFAQYQFDKQWRALRAYAHERGIGLIGDIPIFVAHDSADVWHHKELFRLDKEGEPVVVAGVPPDYFSRTGQRWGNPLYRWKAMRRTGYAWWVARFRMMMARFDAIRLDHFIGFQRYWEIPASEPTAIKGRWMKGPGASLFRSVERALGELPLIAEDLGAVTPKVTALRKKFDLPGIRILQFAFGTDPQAPTFLPHHYPRRCVAYTGTHDNDTMLGWFHERGGGDTSTRSKVDTERERKAALAYLGSDGNEVHWDMIRVLQMSVADTALVPLQDILGLGSDARMNRPGQAGGGANGAHGNWEWRFSKADLTHDLGARLGRLSSIYGRARDEEGRHEEG